MPELRSPPSDQDSGVPYAAPLSDTAHHPTNFIGCFDDVLRSQPDADLPHLRRP